MAQRPDPAIEAGAARRRWLHALAAMQPPAARGSGLPSNCITPAKRLRFYAKRVQDLWDPTDPGTAYCPLRRDPVPHLEQSFGQIAGQASALVRTPAYPSAGPAACSPR